MTAEPTADGWASVCRYDDLLPERGVAALVAGRQVALFRLAGGAVVAVGHHDPFSDANVMARGLVGTRGDLDVVTSPVYKQVFDLRTGRCLDDDAVRLPTWATRVVDGVVQVGPPTSCDPVAPAADAATAASMEP